jgi:ubiquinone/menaquinone biosynthesis C-methylase UbiE/uncharacterized protein YbaR (Trm112 family)
MLTASLTSSSPVSSPRSSVPSTLPTPRPARAPSFSLRRDDARLLVCPSCRGPLATEGVRGCDHLVNGWISCIGCRSKWPVRDGLARLFRDDAVRGPDRLLRRLYDSLAAWHDPATALLMPLLQGTTESAARDRILARLDLAGLERRKDGRAPRILEVGIGAGANLPLFRRDIPAGLDAEIWGVDLSDGMLAECKKRIARERHDVRLVMADAHALPFPSNSFDRVIDVGGIGGYCDPGQALAEMVRVARPGAPIVVVDEQLDPSRARSLLHRAAFRALTFYADDPHCPRELVPAGATDVVEEQISAYYYCLSFRAPK